MPNRNRLPNVFFFFGVPAGPNAENYLGKAPESNGYNSLGTPDGSNGKNYLGVAPQAGKFNQFGSLDTPSTLNYLGVAPESNLKTYLGNELGNNPYTYLGGFIDHPDIVFDYPIVGHGPTYLGDPNDFNPRWECILCPGGDSLQWDDGTPIDDWNWG